MEKIELTEVGKVETLHIRTVRMDGRRFLPHANGGGLVDIESNVDQSVWVGARSAVIGRSVIEGNVILTGDSRVTDVDISTYTNHRNISGNTGRGVLIVDSLLRAGSIDFRQGQEARIEGSELTAFRFEGSVNIKDLEQTGLAN